ncbi:uncharacterized protein TrAFT101_011091 [Trichoderma asperellum]|uniref:uncharacterized protein n=1 Tax=Trichoderma asperellum TaxID=101201 RepID=UPI0033299052|nr:hypothetical protein TrAFT101_011091 [Trichoderma asperellum]
MKTTGISRGIKAAVSAKTFSQNCGGNKSRYTHNMSDNQMSFHSRITRSSYLDRRNDTSETQTSSGSHDYVPIIAMSVIVVVIIIALVLLAQYTKVLDRKRSTQEGDDPENAKNASKIERLDQMVPSKTYTNWKGDSRNADNPLIQGATFISWYVFMPTP